MTKTTENSISLSNLRSKNFKSPSLNKGISNNIKSTLKFSYNFFILALNGFLVQKVVQYSINSPMEVKTL
jgi:hypothetical protein